MLRPGGGSQILWRGVEGRQEELGKLGEGLMDRVVALATNLYISNHYASARAAWCCGRLVPV